MHTYNTSALGPFFGVESQERRHAFAACVHGFTTKGKNTTVAQASQELFFDWERGDE